MISEFCVFMSHEMRRWLVAIVTGVSYAALHTPPLTLTRNECHKDINIQANATTKI